MHFELCQAVRRVLSGDEIPSFLSRRATDARAEIRNEFYWVSPGATELIIDHEGAKAQWWTFAGGRYNAAAAQALATERQHATYDSLSIQVSSGEMKQLPQVLSEVLRRVLDTSGLALLPEHFDRIKFSDCLTAALREALLQARYGPRTEAAAVAKQSVRVRVTSP
jgi:hypothetical protein